MSMEVYNISNEIIIDIDFTVKDFKKFKDDFNNSLCRDNKEDWTYIDWLYLEDLINIEMDMEKWLAISLKTNKDVTYLNSCIPRCDKETIIVNIEETLNILMNQGININSISWSILFNTTEDNDPRYILDINFDNKENLIVLSLLRFKDINDYKKSLEYVCNLVDTGDFDKYNRIRSELLEEKEVIERKYLC